jgi:hypothetical protein
MVVLKPLKPGGGNSGSEAIGEEKRINAAPITTASGNVRRQL